MSTQSSAQSHTASNPLCAVGANSSSEMQWQTKAEAKNTHKAKANVRKMRKDDGNKSPSPLSRVLNEGVRPDTVCRVFLIDARVDAQLFLRVCFVCCFL